MHRATLPTLVVFALCACDGSSDEGGAAATTAPAAGAAASQAAGSPAPTAGGLPAAGATPGAGAGAAAPAAGSTGGAGAGGGAPVTPIVDAGAADAGGPPDAGNAPAADAGAVTIDAGVDAGAVDPLSFAADLHELFIHDECTGVEPSQPDTCLHDQLHETTLTFGGEPGTVYDVTLRVRGLFEPTTISGGQAPLPAHPYFVVGGNVAALDWSHWHIEVSEPAETYWLNHYPSTSHTIYKEDFEATIPIAAGAEVVVRVIDGNTREIDNAENGLADRRQLIDGVTTEVLDGQMLRLDVLDVQAQ